MRIKNEKENAQHKVQKGRVSKKKLQNISTLLRINTTTSAEINANRSDVGMGSVCVCVWGGGGGGRKFKCYFKREKLG